MSQLTSRQNTDNTSNDIDIWGDDEDAHALDDLYGLGSGGGETAAGVVNVGKNVIDGDEIAGRGTGEMAEKKEEKKKKKKKMPTIDPMQLERLRRFHERYNLSTKNERAMKATLIRFHEQEDRLFEHLASKYGPEPPADWVGPSVPSPAAETNHTVNNLNDQPTPTPAALKPLNVGTDKPYNKLYVQRLTAFHAKYLPSKTVAETLDALRHFYGREEELMMKLSARYGPEPALGEKTSTTTSTSTPTPINRNLLQTTLSKTPSPANSSKNNSISREDTLDLMMAALNSPDSSNNTKPFNKVPQMTTLTAMTTATPTPPKSITPSSHHQINNKKSSLLSREDTFDLNSPNSNHINNSLHSNNSSSSNHLPDHSSNAPSSSSAAAAAPLMMINKGRSKNDNNPSSNNNNPYFQAAAAASSASAAVSVLQQQQQQKPQQKGGGTTTSGGGAVDGRHRGSSIRVGGGVPKIHVPIVNKYHHNGNLMRRNNDFGDENDGNQQSNESDEEEDPLYDPQEQQQQKKIRIHQNNLHDDFQIGAIGAAGLRAQNKRSLNGARR